MKALLHDFDTHTTKKIQKWPEWVRPAMLLATLIGQPIFTVGFGALVVGLGWGANDGGLVLAGLIAISTFSAGTLLKLYFRRDRPVTEYVAKMRFGTYSMPSGHAAGSAASYGLLALLIGQAVSSPWHYIVAVFIGLYVILIGVSRIYLGAHYPSDVIVGWLLGLIGLGTILLIAQPQL